MSSHSDSVLFSAAEPFKSRCLIGSLELRQEVKR